MGLFLPCAAWLRALSRSSQALLDFLFILLCSGSQVVSANISVSSFKSATIFTVLTFRWIRVNNLNSISRFAWNQKANKRVWNTFGIPGSSYGDRPTHCWRSVRYFQVIYVSVYFHWSNDHNFGSDVLFYTVLQLLSKARGVRAI